MLYEDAVSSIGLLQKMPGYICLKDDNFVNICLNKNFTDICGYASAEDAIGKTDYDIPCSAAELADNFIEQDKLIMSSQKKLSTLDIIEYKTGWLVLHHNIDVLYDRQQNIRGTECIGVEVPQESLVFKNFLLLNSEDQYFKKNYSKNISYKLTDEHCPLELTSRQQQCLFFWIRGNTAKQIAKKLDISHRTVEEHCEKIKTKLACTNRSQVIEKAISSGFLSYVPSQIFTLL